MFPAAVHKEGGILLLFLICCYIDNVLVFWKN